MICGTEFVDWAVKLGTGANEEILPLENYIF